MSLERTGKGLEWTGGFGHHDRFIITFIPFIPPVGVRVEFLDHYNHPHPEHSNFSFNPKKAWFYVEEVPAEPFPFSGGARAFLAAAGAMFGLTKAQARQPRMVFQGGILIQDRDPAIYGLMDGAKFHHVPGLKKEDFNHAKDLILETVAELAKVDSITKPIIEKYEKRLQELRKEVLAVFGEKGPSSLDETFEEIRAPAPAPQTPAAQSIHRLDF